MTTATTPRTFSVGDAVTMCYHSDREVGIVVKTTAKTVTVVWLAKKLLNGPNSGHPEAMTCVAGGFAAHFSGAQIWQIGEPTGHLDTFRLRKNGRWMSAKTGARLVHGHSPHYDFNF